MKKSTYFLIGSVLSIIGIVVSVIMVELFGRWEFLFLGIKCLIVLIICWIGGEKVKKNGSKNV